jgi:cobalt-zinc-cadmium efflux system outer membrane protein
LQAARTQIQQNQAAEVTANLRPNPTLFTDWEYLPIFTRQQGTSVADYLQASTEGDMGLSYLIERGNKRAHRLQAAKDVTAVTRAQVNDNERGLTFQVGSLFINAELAQSTLELAQMDLKSFQQTVDISEVQYKDGAMSENDYLKIKLQLLQFEQDVEQASLNKAQALSDLRQQLGYEQVTADYDITGDFEYKPLVVTLDELQTKALQNRPDLRATVQGQWKAGPYHLGQLLARQRHQYRDVVVQHSASDFRPEPGQHRANADCHPASRRAAEGSQWAGTDRRERCLRGDAGSREDRAVA